MIRFVATPDRVVVADLKMNLPGRGVWLCADRQSIDTAAASNLFARGLKANISVPASIGDDVDRLLEQAALASLSFARKASQCITGAFKVDSLLRTGKAIALLHALDAAKDGVRKLSGAACVSGRNGRKVTVLKLFASEQMSLALGGENVIHAALINGGAAESFLMRAEMLTRYRGKHPTTGEDDRHNVASLPKDVNQA